MREADGQEELLSGEEPKGYYREAQVTDAVCRGQRQMLEKEPNGLHSGTPSAWAKRRFPFGLSFRVAYPGQKGTGSLVERSRS
jgi:hypothetical protein